MSRHQHGFRALARRLIRDAAIIAAKFPSYARRAWEGIDVPELQCPRDCDGLCDCGAEGPERHAARRLVRRVKFGKLYGERA